MELLFEAYDDEALIAAHEAGVMSLLCNAASLDFQMIKEKGGTYLA